MGTNYYWHKRHDCEQCGAKAPRIHIGKASCGWAFALHVYPDKGINKLKDWEKRFNREGSYITDENGEVIPTATMLTVIKDKTTYSRRNIDGTHCIGHGKKSYDFCIGDFS